MTALIFSDTHLGNHFDPKKYLYLSTIIEGADKVIINGDFWDAYVCSFDQFIHSRWSQLFPLLKSKNAVYIYGNHDEEAWCDRRVELFSDIQGYRYKLQTASSTLHIEHGHTIAPVFADMGRYMPKIRPIGKFLSLRDRYGFKIARTMLINSKKKQNEAMKRWKLQSLEADSTLICGHSHVAEYDKTTKFVNSGCICYGLAQSITVNDGDISLQDTRY